MNRVLTIIGISYCIIFSAVFGFSQSSAILPSPAVYKEMVGEIQLGNTLTIDSTYLALPLRNYMKTQLKEFYGISCLFGSTNSSVRFQTLGKFAFDQNTVGNNMIQHSLELVFKL